MLLNLAADIAIAAATLGGCGLSLGGGGGKNEMLLNFLSARADTSANKQKKVEKK